MAAHRGRPGVEAEGFDTAPRPFEQQMADAAPVWAEIVEQHGLVEPDITRVASWWHTDADLGRDIEVMTDMSKSRLAGFTEHHRTRDSFTKLFERYRAARLIP